MKKTVLKFVFQLVNQKKYQKKFYPRILRHTRNAFLYLKNPKSTYNYSKIIMMLLKKKRFLTTYGLIFMFLYAYNYMKQNKILSKQQLYDRFKLFINFNENNQQMQNIIKDMNSVQEQYFFPSFFLLSGLLQTAYNSIAATKQVNYERQYIPLSDGGQISIDWANPIRIQINDEGNQYEQEYTPSEDNKIIFIVHGLTGGSNMNYIQNIVYDAQKKGYKCAAFNSRGVNTQMTSPQPSDGADLSDLNIALQDVRNRYPNAPIFAVGTSFGGNQIVRWAGEYTKKHGSCFLQGIVGLSTPFDVNEVLTNMGKLYQYVLTDFYKKNLVIPHMDQLYKLSETHEIDWNNVQQANDLQTFYKLTAVKIFGYESVQDLMQKLTITDDHINSIKTPTLLIHSEDDPVVLINSLPIEKLQTNEHMVYIQTSIGGHVCWFTGKNPKRWYPTPTIEFFDSILKNGYKCQQSNKTSNNCSDSEDLSTNLSGSQANIINYKDSNNKNTIQL